MLKELIERYGTILFIAGIVLIILIGWFIFVAIDRQGTRAIPITTVPADAKVEVNGVTTRLGGSTILPIGTHTISVSKEGFSSKTTTLTIDAETDYTGLEPIALAPQSDEALEWARNNREAYGAFSDSPTIIDPIFAYIPFSNLVYSVKSESTTAPVTIDIASLGTYKNAPIEYIKRSGFDPSDYLYTFNYSNPFQGGGRE